MKKRISIDFKAEDGQAQYIEMLLMTCMKKLAEENGGTDLKIQTQNLPTVNQDFELKVPRFINDRNDRDKNRTGDVHANGEFKKIH